MKKLLLITLILGYLVPGNAFAKAKNTANSASVTLRLIDSHIEELPLYLLVMDDYLYSDVGAKVQDCMPDANGNYKFQIKGITKPVAIHLQFDTYRFYSGFISPGDDIKITYTRLGHSATQKELSFSGRGSYKMAVGWKISFAIPEGLNKIAPSTAYTKNSADSLISKANSTYRDVKHQLEGYRDSLGSQMFGLLDAKMFAITYYPIIDYFTLGQRSNISEENLRYYMEKIRRISATVSPEIACQSKEYVNYLVRRATTLASIDNDDPKKKFMDCFREIMTQQNVMLREKMLVSFILSDQGFRRSEDPEKVYSKALANISTPAYRKIIEELRLARRKGTAVLDFSVTDTNGKVVRLSDFKNKVVVIDCWFTGCIPCAHLARVMGREVIPQFKERKDVVFLSVNVDKNKNKWMNSLKDEEFSYPGVLNVYTQGLGVEHPFLKKYGFRGFPQLLLIGRSGQIISANIRGTGIEITGRIRGALDSK